MKRVLYFYPHSFDKISDGIHMRVVTILQYFKSRNVVVDMVCFENETVTNSYLTQFFLVQNLYTVPSASTHFTGIKYIDIAIRILQNKISKIANHNRLSNKMTRPLRLQISNLISKNTYTYVFIVYPYYADIIAEFEKQNIEVKKIVDPTDFLTLQQFYYSKVKPLSAKQIGAFFGSEISRYQKFDDILYISNDELFTFSNFLPNQRHHYIPQFFEKREVRSPSPQKTYDILYIGSGNPYNRIGICWFLDKVLPLIGKNVSIAIAGNICKWITTNNANTHLLGFVTNIEELYQKSRLSICPIFSGSGIKIKVVESLNYGLPIVTTIKGVDGFINKQPAGGVLVAADAAEFARHILQLINDEAYYQNQCRQAVQIFDTHFSTEVNYKKLDAIFQ